MAESLIYNFACRVWTSTKEVETELILAYWIPTTVVLFWHLAVSFCTSPFKGETINRSNVILRFYHRFLPSLTGFRFSLFLTLLLVNVSVMKIQVHSNLHICLRGKLVRFHSGTNCQFPYNM